MTLDKLGEFMENCTKKSLQNSNFLFFLALLKTVIF
jgi:hypothetical protein